MAIPDMDDHEPQPDVDACIKDEKLEDQPERIAGPVCTLARDHWYVVNREEGPAVCVYCGKPYSPND